ncbi:MAG: L-threonylcarbamoyladenylate synthase [Planctomycetota bacterium]
MPDDLVPGSPAQDDTERERVLSAGVSRLAAGEPVGVPTETVYGLAADALNADAVRRIFELKGRPATNPLSCLVANAEMGRRWLAAHWPTAADALADAFWPGPLTIVLPRQHGIPDIVTAGQATIGIRVPDQDLTLEVITRFGRPVAAPSANRSGDASPITAEDVHRAFADNPDLLVLDGGRCKGGVESTVVRIEPDDEAGAEEHRSRVTVLRPGMLSTEQLNDALGETGRVVSNTARSSASTAPASVVSSNRIFWFERHDWSRVQAELTADDTVVAIAHHPDPAGIAASQVKLLPGDHAACAREFYATFHAASAGGGRVFIERPDESAHHDGAWAAIRDRIERLASPWATQTSSG